MNFFDKNMINIINELNERPQQKFKINNRIDEYDFSTVLKKLKKKPRVKDVIYNPKSLKTVDHFYAFDYKIYPFHKDSKKKGLKYIKQEAHKRKKRTGFGLLSYKLNRINCYILRNMCLDFKFRRSKNLKVFKRIYDVKYRKNNEFWNLLVNSNTMSHQEVQMLFKHDKTKLIRLNPNSSVIYQKQQLFYRSLLLASISQFKNNRPKGKFFRHKATMTKFHRNYWNIISYLD